MAETGVVTVIGGGLAGCEAAWQLARRGVAVDLWEMKPYRFSPAHTSADLAELVCSNSFRGAGMENAVGVLKEELRILGSLIMESADLHAVPAGGALAVDRTLFSREVTERIAGEPLISIHRGEVTDLSGDGVTIVASGPLTSDALARTLSGYVGESLYFYDAIAPVVTADSIDHSVAFSASRYGKGGGDDYLNLPFTKEEYLHFVELLRSAEKVPPRDFERAVHFEGCMPVEELAERGVDTLRFGPMKPVGLTDPRTGREPYAVVQLRREDREGTLWNLVGFQTKLTHPEQRRVFREIPGLAGAEFARLGSMHRNTFVNAPRLLTVHQQLKDAPRILLAGQITGVEGYVESTASGFLAGVTAAAMVRGVPLPLPPEPTLMRGLIRHLTESDPGSFQPSNVTWGHLPPPEGRGGKKERRRIMAERALESVRRWRGEIGP